MSKGWKSDAKTSASSYAAENFIVVYPKGWFRCMKWGAKISESTGPQEQDTRASERCIRSVAGWIPTCRASFSYLSNNEGVRRGH